MVFDAAIWLRLFTVFDVREAPQYPRTHPSMTHRNLNVPDSECKTHRAIYTLNPRGLECCNPPNTSDSSSDLSCRFSVRTHQEQLLWPRGDTVGSEQHSAAYAGVRPLYAHFVRHGERHREGSREFEAEDNQFQYNQKLRGIKAIAMR